MPRAMFESWQDTSSVIWAGTPRIRSSALWTNICKLEIRSSGGCVLFPSDTICVTCQLGHAIPQAGDCSLLDLRNPPGCDAQDFGDLVDVQFLDIV